MKMTDTNNRCPKCGCVMEGNFCNGCKYYQGKSRWKNALDEKTKGVLTLLIHEIQEIIDSPKLDDHERIGEIYHLLQHWIKPNDLHPERVKTIPKEFTQRVMKGDQTVWDEIFHWYEKGEKQ